MKGEGHSALKAAIRSFKKLSRSQFIISEEFIHTMKLRYKAVCDLNGQLPPYYALETILSELSEVPELSGFIVVKDNELNAIEKPAETITIIDFYRYSTAILDYVKSSNTDSLALHTEALDSWGTEIICILLTNLHAKFVEYYLADPGVEFPREKFPDVKALAEATLRQFSRRNLRAVTRFGVGAIIRPVEATYQDEFYRSLHTVLGYAMNVTSEWSPDGVGRIDFRLSSVRWGIELLREGDRLHDHCQRFTTDGAYGKWIQQGLLEDWLVIDCRTSSPRSYEIPDTKLWRAVFAPDFSDVEVRDQYNQVVVDRFALTE